MNKYWFKLKLDSNATAWVQQVYWADTLEEAEQEIQRLYGDIYYEHFTPVV